MNITQLYDEKKTNYYDWQRREMLSFIPNGCKKILDVGCAGGSFGALLKLEKQAEVWGIEHHLETAERARKKLDRVIVGDIESGDLSLPTSYFDCIVFNDALEHFRDPWDVLVRISENLIPGGYVVASIPNIRHFEVMKDLLIRREWRYVQAGVLDKTHLRFFTDRSMVDLFTQSGYDVETVSGINGKAFPWKFSLLNRILLNALDDMRYVQFACVAKHTQDSRKSEQK